MTHFNNTFYRHLTDDGLAGDGTNQNANVNGASTAVPFYAGPTEGIWKINRMIVSIEDDANITASGYGGLATLTNGVSLKVHTGGVTGEVLVDLMDGETATSIVDWGDYCYDVTPHTFGSGTNFVLVRWTFGKAGGPLRLQAHTNDVLVATVQDDLSTLVKHHFFIQGKQVPELND